MAGYPRCYAQGSDAQVSTLKVTRSIMDAIDDGDTMVCVFCDQDTTLPYCPSCQEYKGLMTIAEWESYTGEVWE